MGLVAFSPIDALFTPPGGSHGKAANSQGLPGEFTALLAALLGSAAGEPADVPANPAGHKESLGSLLALLNAGHSRDDEKPRGMPAFAALVTSLLHPAATPVDPPDVVEQSVGAAVQPVGPFLVDLRATEAPTVSPALPAGDHEVAEALESGSQTVDAPPAVRNLAAPPTVGGPPAPLDVPVAPAGDVPGLPANLAATVSDALPLPAPSGPTTGPATIVDAIAVTTFVQVAELASPQSAPAPRDAAAPTATGRGDDHRPGDVHAESGPDPAGPPESVNLPEGVVRFVGNAQKGRHEGQQDFPGRPDDERGVPRASAQGIAHASDHSAVAQLRTPPADAPPADQAGPPPAPATQPQAVEQVAQAVIEKVEAGGGEARIRLDPPELGEVTIHVKISGDHVRIDVHAERLETTQLLRDRALDLTGLLSGRGLDLTDVYVGLGGRQAPDTRGDQDSGALARHGQSGDFAAVLGIDEEPPASDRYSHLRAAYNPDGAYVFRI